MAYTDHIVVDGVQYDVHDKDAVSFAQEQTLTEAQQEQARENIGAGSEADVVELKSQIDEISEVVHSKNLYDPSACNPQDGKVYNNSHVLVNSSSYAVTGKIPVEGNTQYIFSAGANVTIAYVVQFGGDNGQTFISETKINGAAFTTNASCTFVDFEIFSRSHTTDEFNAAIAVAQLEVGNVATDYVPYSVTRMIPTSALEDAVAINGAINYTVTESPINLYNKALAVDGQYFNTSTLKFVANANTSHSGFIPVKPNTQYNMSCDENLTYKMSGGVYFEFDATKAFIKQGTVFNGNSGTMIQIQTSATCAYIVVNFTSASHTATDLNDLINSIMLCYGTQRPLDYSAYNPEPLVNYEKLSDAYAQNADAFCGKKWLVTGTSVSYQDSKLYTEGVAEGERIRGYIGNVARHKAMLVTNQGISGSTLADTTQDSALINRYQSLDFGSYDFITIEYGINDFGRNVPVGTAQDAAGTSTFAACLKTIIEYALTQNPIVGLIICTDPDVRGTTTNQNGNTLKDYADVTLEIAAQYRLPVCDWFYHSGINSLTKGDGSSRYYLTQSGTHPSVYGHMRMGAMLNQVFDSLLC